MVSSPNIKRCTMVTQGIEYSHALAMGIEESLFPDADGFDWLQDVELEHPSNGDT